MRTVVALVEARPETIADDYRRVMDLAGLPGASAANRPQLLMSTGSTAFRPGWGTTPWQLSGALGWLGEAASETAVVGVDEHGAGTAPADPLWRDCLDRYLAEPAGLDFLRNHRHNSQLLHPALDAILPAGVQLPVGLASGPSLLLPVPSLRPGWGVSGAVEMLQRLVTQGAAPGRRAPAAEVAAEALGVARELMPEMGVVVDGTLWGVTEGAGGQSCVARNILLASRDPLAVDAVAMRLAGIDPVRVPWVRICWDRGFGQAHPSAMKIVGRTDLLDLDFELKGGTFAAPRDGLLNKALGPVGSLLGRAGNKNAAGGLADTAWGQLYEEYVSGQIAAASGR